MAVELTQTVKCRWCDRRETSPHGWGQALTMLHRHIVAAHPEHQFEQGEDRALDGAA